MKRFLYILLPAVVFLCACKKKDDEPAFRFTNIPNVTSVSTNVSGIRAWQDSIVFTIGYNDGDGDLGENKEGVENLFIRDNNTGVTTGFRVPQLAPGNSKIKIQGTLEVVLRSVGKNGTGSETTAFTVWIVDRSGNKSREMTSEKVTVTD
jgi:hypothetical protein